jgi:DNA/RNA endonuclease YhcR with UshA esterase domain
MATPVPTVTPVPPTSTPSIQTIATGQLSALNINQTVAITGQIVEATSFTSGVKFYVDDGSGRAALWVPQPLYEQLTNAAQLVVGNTVRVQGRVQEYKQELEVVPQVTDDVVLVAVVAPDQVVLAQIGDLTLADVDRTVTVEGQIVEVNPFSQGIKYGLDDGSGRVTLLLWQNVHDAVPKRDQLALGTVVRATGKVTEYQGELQVIPGLGYDLVVK